MTSIVYPQNSILPFPQKPYLCILEGLERLIYKNVFPWHELVRKYYTSTRRREFRREFKLCVHTEAENDERNNKWAEKVDKRDTEKSTKV